MSAKDAKSLNTPAKTVRKGASEICSLQPKYLHHNLWKNSPTLSPTTANWTEHPSPLPCIPLSEVSNTTAYKTISDNPSLFQVVTPIKVEVFEALLKNHPNPSFVRSVCMGLHEGF